jgi:fermentation-respiration switch protein FrsA (DUF1100 family)
VGVRITDRRLTTRLWPSALLSRVLFKPLRGLETDPSRVGLVYEDVELTADDGVKLHAWHVRMREPRAVVVVLHGNAGNICRRIEHAAAYAREGMDTLLVGYRGYGGSGGKPTEEGLYNDAVGAIDHAASLGVPVVVYGESIGGAVAVEAALRRTPSMLVLQSTFTSIPDIASKMLPIVGRHLAPRVFMSIDKVSRLTCPTLVIHGDRDEAIPHAMGVRLYEALRTRKVMLTVPGAMHNDVFEIAGTDIARRIAMGESGFGP